MTHSYQLPSTLLVLCTLLSGQGACTQEIWLRPPSETLQDDEDETGLDKDETDEADTGSDDTDTTDPDTGEPDDEPGDPGSCEDMYDEATGTRFYVDPASGDDSNDGSSTAPWASLQVVFDNYVDCSSEDGTRKHSDAPVKGGDVIVLRGRDGYSEPLSINGCYNTDYVRVVAETHREPELRFLKLRGGAYWHFEGLTFLHDGGGQMFKVENHNSHGQGHHIRLHDNLMTSGDLKTKADYVNKSSDAIRLNQTDHTSITCNSMVKVAQALTISGDSVDVLHNHIELFTRDAIVNSGSDNRYIGNKVYDNVKLGDGHHDDFFQSHMGSYPDTSSNVVIAYNLFMNRYRSQQPSDTYGPTQCVGAFEEGPKTNWSVYNNVCKTDHYHGITLKSMSNSSVMNNTVVGGGDLPGEREGSSPPYSWINLSGSDNTVRNNLTTHDSAAGENTIIVTRDNVYDIFMDFDNLDLSLKPDSVAVDAGALAGAPADDVLGVLRDSQPDVGAYEVP